MKISRRKTGALAFLMLFAVLIVTMHACMPDFRMSRKEVDDYFKRNNIHGSQLCYKTGFREIHYIKTGDDSRPLVLFIHGSPGSLSAFISFMADTALSQRALLVCTDRPGFGHSNYGNAEPSLHNQAEALIPIVKKYKNNRPVILVGHSLGGPLISRIAMDYPELIDGLVIVAGSIDPELEPNETWFRAPLASPFLNWILPGSFRASNEEIYHLKPELETMLPMWKNIKCPVIVIQGTGDELVSPGNAAFAEKMLVNASLEVVRVEGMNHFVPWSNPELIHDAVIRMIGKLNPLGHADATAH
jgi:pimeloyl-ACP methyl ester carboxylesterase